jgi:hypothetical protein
MPGFQFYVLDFDQVKVMNDLSALWRIKHHSPSPYEQQRFEVTGQHNNHRLSWWAVPTSNEDLASYEKLVAEAQTVAGPKKIDRSAVVKGGVELIAAMRATPVRTGRDDIQ